MKLRERLISLMQSEQYVPMDKKEILSNLDLSKKDSRKLDYELRLLLSSGDVIRIKGDRFCMTRDADLVTGKILFRQTGSAMVIPGGASNEKQPIKIDAEDTSVAMHGDEVVVRLYDEFHKPRERRRKRRRPGEKIEPDGPFGRVIRIKERARTTIVGNLQKTRFFYYVVPDDPRIINDIYVPDPKKSDLQPKPKIGCKVVVKLHEWEQKHVNPEGEIIENLGKTHEPQAELMAILHKYDLDLKFPQAVVSEAKAINQNISKEQLKGRLDLRDVFTITIDPDDAKDFDDALSVQRLDSKLIKVGIHIADVGTYVKHGTQMDKEAQARGNSTYLVGTVIPMLPHELSNGICSLKEGVDRLVKSVFITFTRGGKAKDFEFYNSVIKSDKRLTYKQAYGIMRCEQLQEIRELKLPPAHQTGFTGRALNELSDAKLDELRENLKQLWVIAAKLRSDRMRKGSLDLDMPETKIFVDENGYADRLEKIINDESHQLIEEFMLAANEAVAKALNTAGLPCIYRSHDDPEEERLEELKEFLGTFGVEAKNLLERKEMMRVIKALEAHPQAHLLKTQVLRSLKKAAYTSSADGHYGLYKRFYCHFTSPIRRYADLVVHRVFEFYLVKFAGREPLHGDGSRYYASRIASLAEHLSRTEVNSIEAERESVKVKLLEFFERELEKKAKTQFTAVITEVRNHGMFVELTESGAFGMIHISTLTDDLYRVEADGSSIVGRKNHRQFRVGQKINVLVHRVDRFKRQVDFRLPLGKNRK